MNIGVIGTGNMGKALIGGLVKKYSNDVFIRAFDLNESAYTGLPSVVNISSPETWFEKNVSPDAIVISVKPSDVANALKTLGEKETNVSKPIWISIAAGVSIKSLEKLLPADCRICRVMPNTPALIGEAISAFSLNKNCGPNDASLVESVLGACGKTVNVPEKMINAVTGLSGSGPAYVFLFIEALIEGGVTAGLPYNIARECALQTIIGSAKMLSATNDNPSVLKSKVMSPSGTTASGLLALERNAFKYSVISAVLDAAKRAEQLDS